ncbi:MAG TPA: PqqD family protein [Vicinamibacterales bacterium]|nr:PqqD family protein [Vicinamibacterales bacterium]
MIAERDRPERFPPDASVVASDRQLSTTLAGEVIILGLDDSMYYGLSGAGTRIWELLQSPRTIGDVIDAIAAEFDADRARIAADLDALLADLASRGLIAITRPPVDR